jgi:hypothetical protein
VRVKIVGPEAKPLVVIDTDDGRHLAVTTKHPMLLPGGDNVAAERLAPGMVIAGADGPTRVKTIGSQLLPGTEDVINLELEQQSEGASPADLRGYVLADGIVTGDFRRQQELEGIFVGVSR